MLVEFINLLFCDLEADDAIGFAFRLPVLLELKLAAVFAALVLDVALFWSDILSDSFSVVLFSG